MAKAKQSNLEMYQRAAQYLTMIAAILYGILWALTGLLKNSSSTTDTISSVLIGATAVGGILMGLLYAIHPSKK